MASASLCADANRWRIMEAFQLPNWLEVYGEQRTRYETLDGQFRAGRSGGDQALALRTSLTAQLKANPGRLVVELLDSRQYFSDSGSIVDDTMVNALDVLQAHIRWDAGGLMHGGTNTLRFGRETLDLGMRRLVARNAFRNTINSFTGLDWLWEAEGGGSVRAFYLLPVTRLPGDPGSLFDNEIVADTQSFETRFWGLYGTSRKLPFGTVGEAYYLRLQENAAVSTRHRSLHTAGFRLFRNPRPAEWDMEVEAAWQFGRSQSVAGLNVRRLDHEAYFAHGTLGYTAEMAWGPRVAARYDFASGDGDPGDGRNGRFDTLYGARRFDYGPTGIYGAVARANLNSPEYSFSVRPCRSVEALVSHRFLRLAEPRDAWAAAGVRDSSGTSGNRLGQQLEFRIRWNILPGNCHVDAGYTRLMAGRFLRDAPNATRQGDVQYAYCEVTFQF